MKRSDTSNRPIRDLLFPASGTDAKSRRPFWRSVIAGWLLFIALLVVVTAILNVKWEPLPSHMVEDSIAVHDIRSDKAYTIVDTEETGKLKDKVRSKILPVYRYDTSILDEISARITQSFTKVRDEAARLRSNLPEEAEELSPQQIESLRTLFTDTLGVSHSVRDFQALVDQDFSQSLETTLIATTAGILKHPIVEQEAILEPHRESGVLLITGSEASAPEKILDGKAVASIKTVVEARDSVKLQTAGRSLDPELQSSLKILVQDFIVPTTRFDVGETQTRRLAAEGEVEDVIIRVQPGESIIRAGDRFDSRIISVIEGIKVIKAQYNFRWKFLGTGLFLFCFLLALYVFASRFLQRFNPRRRDLIFLGSSLVLAVGIFRASLAVGTVLRDAAHFMIPVTAIYYVVPLAGMVMVVRLVRNAQEAFIFAAASAVVVGLAPDVQFSFVAYYLLSALVAIGALARTDTRTVIWRAGLLTGLSQVFLVVTFELIRSTEIMVALNLNAQMWNLGLAFVGGLLSAAVALAFSALAESIFGYLTDIRLLELGSLNHPLLRELIVRAPGTYHHSHLVGTLAEAGCQAIGANGLYARVAAYFHDIGKMAKSDYFIENQSDGINRHDSLAPSMSALIIQNHVKDGMEMARKAKLPEQIIDIIPQHQGTKLIRYFYSKAKEQEEPEVSPVSEKDYRYPGPKPQTREAGVILLADGVEAASRALSDKTPTKIRGVVERMINTNFTDGQFDDCELTLKDLHDIADAFSNILVAIYHQRIEYPDLPMKEKGGTHLRVHDEKDQYSEPQPIADSTARTTPDIIKHPATDTRRR